MIWNFMISNKDPEPKNRKNKNPRCQGTQGPKTQGPKYLFLGFQDIKNEIIVVVVVVVVGAVRQNVIDVK